MIKMRKKKGRRDEGINKITQTNDKRWLSRSKLRVSMCMNPSIQYHLGKIHLLINSCIPVTWRDYLRFISWSFWEFSYILSKIGSHVFLDVTWKFNWKMYVGHCYTVFLWNEPKGEVAIIGWALKNATGSHKAMAATSSNPTIILWFPRNFNRLTGLAYPIPLPGFAVLTLV